MRSLALLLAVALSGTNDSVKLAHAYTKDDTTTYTLKVEAKEQGLKIEGDILEKVLSETKDNATEVELSSSKITMSANGSQQESSPSIKSKLDAKGIPDKMSAEEDQIPLMIVRLVSILPNEDVEVGKPFKVEWNSEAVGKYTSTSTLKEIKEVDGKKQWLIDSEINFTPHENTQGVLKVTNTFDASGKLLKSAGTLSVMGMTIDLSIVKK